MSKMIKKNNIEMFEPATKVELPFNEADLEFMAADLEACEDEPGFLVMLDSYTGPATGLVYDEDTKKLHIAEGWHVNENGFIVKDTEKEETEEE